MPSSKASAQHPRQDPWLPAQVLLQPRVERDAGEIEDLDLAKMDDDPFIYFLTPTPSSYVQDETSDFDMDFDAGIEDSKHPAPIVRSISPSSLGGLSRPPPRPPTPPKSPATPDLDYDLSATPDEHEEYDYMESWPPKRLNPLSLPRRLKDKFKGNLQPDADATESLAPPASPQLPRASTRGRAVSRSGPKPIASSTGSTSRTRRSGGMPSRLSPHAWREPSPDVWSIEEEPENELHSEMEGSSFIEEGVAGVDGKTRAVDIPAAKPKKKVRFVLPAVEDTRSAY